MKIRLSLAILFGAVLVVGIQLPAQAVPFPATIVLTEANHIDPVSNTGVEVRLDLEFTPADETLIVDVFNLSDTTFAPGIAGFGFDIGELAGTISSWMLTAVDSNGTPVTVGGSAPPPPELNFWQLDAPGGVSGAAGILNFNYYPNTIDNKDGSLYNPAFLTDPALPGAGLLPGGGNTNFFTEATLKIVFEPGGDLTYVDRGFARLQNVGPGPEPQGSLKLVGDPDNGGTPVPEPATILLLAVGLLGVAGVSRKKFKIGR